MRRVHGGQTLGSLANGSFVVVDSETAPETARRRLGGLRYAVVVSGERVDGRGDHGEPGQPFALCTATDLDEAHAEGAATLARATLPATLVLAAGLTLGELAVSDTMTLLDLSPHGSVVLNGAEIVGVLENPVVDSYLADSAMSPGETRGMGGSRPSDSTLGGAPQLPAARVVCGRAGCGYVNQLSFYDHAHPPRCQNRASGEHLLVIARK